MKKVISIFLLLTVLAIDTKAQLNPNKIDKNTFVGKWYVNAKIFEIVSKDNQKIMLHDDLKKVCDTTL